mgnify:FL=1
MLFKETATEWIMKKKNYIKESTYSLYRYEMEQYIFPMIGNLEIADITEQLVQEAVLQWQKEQNAQGHLLKQSTVQNLVVLTKQVIKYAIKQNYLLPIKIDIHYANESIVCNKEKVFDDAELIKLITAARTNLTPETLGILLCVNSGLRIGEICALVWGDFDLEQGILHVSKTLQRIYTSSPESGQKSHVCISLPKTKSSIRDIPLTQQLCAAIRSISDRQPNHYMLTNSDRYMEPRIYRKHYDLFLQKNGIKKHNFHCLRHTFATRCIANGLNYKVVSELLGHSTINITLNMYVHPQMSEKRKCIETIYIE